MEIEVVKGKGNISYIFNLFNDVTRIVIICSVFNMGAQPFIQATLSGL